MKTSLIAFEIRFAPRWIGAFALTAVLAACGGGGDDAPPPAPIKAANHLYTESNETTNTVVHFSREPDGSIARKETTSTGGAGTNAVGPTGNTAPDSLVSQHAVTISADSSTLFAVNGGDNSISVFSIDPNTGGLKLLKKNSTSAGVTPNSLVFSNGYLYATFIKGPSQLGAFKVAADGTLTQLAAYDLVALAGIPAAAVPTQLVVSPDGQHVVVNAGTASNAILSFSINVDGTLTPPVTNTAQITSPFAGVFVPGAAAPTYLVTSTSTVSLTSYGYTVPAGTLTQLNQAVAAGVAAPCWISITPDGKVAFVGNGSGAISSFSIGTSGQVTLLNSTAAIEPSVVTGVGSVAADSWVSPDGKFLYTAYLGADKVVAYSIGQSGSLAKINEITVGTSTHLSLQGLIGL